MAYKLGMDAVLKYGTAGTTANTALASVRNVTLNLEKGEADVTTRGNGGWKATVATLKDASVEFEMVWDTADAGFTAIKNSYFNNTAISLLILDAATGGQGLDADFMVTKFTREEPLDEAIVAAACAQSDWAAHTGKERAAILRRLQDLMVANADDLATIITAEMGKPRAEARGEVLYGASYVEWFAEEAKRVYGETIPGHQRDKRLTVSRQPCWPARWPLPLRSVAPWSRNPPNSLPCQPSHLPFLPNARACPCRSSR